MEDLKERAKAHYGKVTGVDYTPSIVATSVLDIMIGFAEEETKDLMRSRDYILQGSKHIEIKLKEDIKIHSGIAATAIIDRGYLKEENEKLREGIKEIALHVDDMIAPSDKDITNLHKDLEQLLKNK